jgi:hypothetical protein
MHNSGVSCRGNEKLYLAVIASAAKQSIVPQRKKEEWIASLRSQ